MGPLAALLIALVFAPAEDYLDQAIKALDANQPVVAEPLLRKATEAEPGDYVAHFHLALTLSLLNRDPEAVAEYRKTLELKPGLREAELNLGIVLLRDKQAAEAVPLLRAVTEAKPGDARTELFLAQALLDSGDNPGAEEHFRKVLAADAASQPAKLGLGQALLAEAKFDEAAQAFREAGSQQGIAAVVEARRAQGEKQIDDKDAAGAIATLEDAVKQAPTTANRLALADAYRLAKQPDKVIEQLSLASRGEPANFEIHMALGRSLRDQHRLIPAANEFFTATKLKPDSVPAWNELASVLIVNENYAEGLAALDKVKALGKEIPGDLFLRALSLDHLKMKPQALSAYQQFLNADAGAHPDQEFQARQRARIIENELKKK
jgi:tetratricopeptide (TPR) repeat protein